MKFNFDIEYQMSNIAMKTQSFVRVKLTLVLLFYWIQNASLGWTPYENRSRLNQRNLS